MVALFILTISGLIVYYVPTHSKLIEKDETGECPMWSHRQYGLYCTSNMTNGSRNYQECMDNFANPDEEFVCRQDLCFNKGGDTIYLDTEGFCREICPNRTEPIPGG
jgi:hypothetical protein